MDLEGSYRNPPLIQAYSNSVGSYNVYPKYMFISGVQQREVLTTQR